MDIFTQISATAPIARLHSEVAPRFEALREAISAASGIDFLARVGDALRASDFVSNKDGVANRSWHKTGRAFDYDQSSSALVIVGEPLAGKQFFRTFLKCSVQDGSLGNRLALRDYRGFSVNAFVVDFTEAAESAGFSRIPAWNGWKTHYNRREFWHYERRDGLTWDEAMLELRGKQRTSAEKVIGRSDRGEAVREIQIALNARGFLPSDEIDEIFGGRTFAAVTAFQRRNGLSADGLVGPKTRAELGI